MSEVSNKQKLKNIVVWVDALESGQYKQGKEQLGDAKSGFCCLGVGCNVLGIEYNPHSEISKVLAEKTGLAHEYGKFTTGEYFGLDRLTTINDETNAGFKRIAKLIKNHPDWLFIPEVAELVKEHYKKAVKP